MNPYRIEGPALISFSGGRTSAYMLFMILQAWGGKLPSDVYVVFANTGKELEETLRFVHECSLRWGVKVLWLERLPGGGFIEVTYETASRSGEPFAQLIREKSYLPNAVTRFCTVELKIRVMRDFAVTAGFERWNNVIGLRYDEGLRVMKALARNDEGKERFKAIMPMAKAKATKRGHVMPFWFGEGIMRVPNPIPTLDQLLQGFDLGLQDYEGNCDLCFLKSVRKLERIIRNRPGSEKWWAEQEIAGKGRFVTEYSYSDIRNYVEKSPELFGDDDHDVECGLTCAPDNA
jgi:3'-phosphoadenosine 5'-phosphosulfate sulfotransferase (PAPS reductase)/FAD synthetase